jgi:hypothetical protein
VCGKQTVFAPRVRMMRRKVRTTAPAQLVCRSGPVRALGVPKPSLNPNARYTGYLQIRGSNRRVLYAILSPATYSVFANGPVLQYDASVCKKVRTLVPSRRWLAEHPAEQSRDD